MQAATTINQAQARAEQAAVEATVEYELEQAFRTIEDALFALLDAEEEAARREASAVARDGLKAYERKPFSLMR